MSNKQKVCVLIPFSTRSACGLDFPCRNSFVRSQVTCKACKKTDYYKKLRVK